MDERESKALRIVRRLTRAGFRAYFAGGCVRDRVLGVTPKDYDVATDARPEVVQRMFDNTVAVGAKFGVIGVVPADHSKPIEVATFRADAPYVDGRHPSSVRFGTIEEDAIRRDFTIGGMFYDPATDRVIDLVGGMRDLKAGTVRAIGNPYDRFDEDHLRILRAARFAARMDFTIEPATWAAMKRTAPTIIGISPERIGQEMVMIMTEGGAARGIDLLLESGLMQLLLPEVVELIGCEQPANFHPEGDVYTHTRIGVSMLPAGASETIAFGILLHDIAKPRCRAVSGDKVTFYGHTEQGAVIAAEMLARLKRSRATQERVAYLVKNHLKLCMAPRMRQATLKRMLADDGFDELMEVAFLDAFASSSYLGFWNFCRDALNSMGKAEIRPTPLITGKDLKQLGFAPGPRFKAILKEVEDRQLDGLLSSPKDAIEFVLNNYFITELT
ncbi:MAG: CCA tRNA nucleotidyltransferase [Candidatus Binatus sp.]|uniref:CCA tRNA nucleotidyltransferase n=1 Tax=Candidatus Binatus sp. TaxID=2811406 RepID=UPI00271FCE0C|nr:CCA tRNA nucleotidyltransferase [Candidatus Binatus sp.]MDO8432270.1 CCA tRNA nucleotidyltransferase [Candidatus Binatus sp.]